LSLNPASGVTQVSPDRPLTCPSSTYGPITEAADDQDFTTLIGQPKFRRLPRMTMDFIERAECLLDTGSLGNLNFTIIGTLLSEL
jgi:hypothetical protein